MRVVSVTCALCVVRVLLRVFVCDTCCVVSYSSSVFYVLNCLPIVCCVWFVVRVCCCVCMCSCARVCLYVFGLRVWIV